MQHVFYPTPQQVRRVQPELRSFVFLFFAIRRAEGILCDAAFGPESGGWRRKSSARECTGRWRNESSPSWKRWHQLSFLIDLTTAESTYFYLTGSFYWTGREKRDRNVSCWRIPPSNPGFNKGKQELQSRYITQWLRVTAKKKMGIVASQLYLVLISFSFLC